MVGMVANLDNYSEEELKHLETAIATRRDELSEAVPPTTKEMSDLIHDLIIDVNPEDEGYAGMGSQITAFCPSEMGDHSVVDIETQTGHKFIVEIHRAN